MQDAAGDGSSDVDVPKALVKQQAVLQSLIEMQSELRGIVLSQHRALERRLDTICKPTGDRGPEVNVGSEGQARTVTFQAPAVGDQGKVNDSEQAETPKPPEKRGSAGSINAASMNVFRAPKKLVNQLEKKFEASPSRESTIHFGKRQFRKMVRRVLSTGYWDSIMGVLIIMNFVAIYAELEWKRYDLAFRLGMVDHNHDWDSAERVFGFLEKSFNAIFVMELLMHFFAFGISKVRKDFLRALDMLAIALSATDSFIFDPLLDSTATKTLTLLRVVRVCRALRLLRFLRVLRFMGMFGALRVLVMTIAKSVGSLVWSMAVVGIIIVSSAMFMATLAQDILIDDALAPELKAWVYKYYAGSVQASYTMFEATFSGKWATVFSDRLVREVSPYFSIFWIFYTVSVNFAVMRVLSALFLKQTLDVAAIDAERTAAIRIKEQEKILCTLRQIFEKGDESKDGVLSREEFEQMMMDDEVLEMFESLDLDTPELHMLFNILCEDDGVADQEEFLSGAMKLKTHVKTVDIIQLMHESMVIKRHIALLAGGVQTVDTALHPANPWDAHVITDHTAEHHHHSSEEGGHEHRASGDHAPGASHGVGSHSLGATSHSLGPHQGANALFGNDDAF